MSNYCDGCPYDVSKKSAEDACPFNALYWNHRLAQIYSSWDRISPEKRQAYRESASSFLQTLDDCERV
jgi:deoxyribodipyrimidine photolyase-related protein